VILWFIRHKPTGYYIPVPYGRAGRGGSHTEPNMDDNQARIFTSKRAAAGFISAWIKGKWTAHRGYDPGSPGNDWACEYYEEITVKHVPSRNKDDMEIISVEVKLP